MFAKKNSDRKIEIDLNGPDGNAFVILGYARQLNAKVGRRNWEEFHAEMTSDDYEHLLEVFEKNFGAFVIMCR